MRASHEFVEGVTSDLCFVARADTLEGLFAAAADAVFELTHAPGVLHRGGDEGVT